MIKQKKIVTVATESYRDYLFVFLESLKKHFKGDCEVVVIHRDLSQKSKEKCLSLMNKSFTLSFYCIADFPKKSIFGSLLDNPVYWRLVAPLIVDKDDGQILYIDIDTLVRDDFSEVFYFDLKGKTVGACIDYLNEIHMAISNWHALGLKPNSPYFNAGVLLIDVSRYRKKKILERVIEIVIKNSDYLVVSGKWPQNDQYGLNVALYDDWLILPDIYNYGSELTFKLCKIVHFIGNGKPTSNTCMIEFKTEFANTLDGINIPK